MTCCVGLFLLLTAVPGLVVGEDAEFTHSVNQPNWGTVFKDGAVQATVSYPSWHRKLSSIFRFELVMDGKAVLDKETGLVWAKDVKISSKAPDHDSRYPHLKDVLPSLPAEKVMTWDVAIWRCTNFIISDRKGWRLPNREELASLLDMSVEGSPKLPYGHPFINVETACYWTNTPYASDTDFEWEVDMFNGFISNSKKDRKCYIWPVRSGN
jgi:uncharacterized protein DUF1566